MSAAPDLFDWRDEADAAEQVALTEAARLEALRARRCAPHGQVRARQARLEEATRAALEAQLVLQRVQAGRGAA